MAHPGETDDANRTEALVWAAPTGQLPAPPIDTKAQQLPIGELHWPDAERLFLRLLHTIRPVQYAKLFGVPGQAQAGIDAYARLPVDLTDGETNGRDYITLQSRRVKSLTTTKIKKAVDELLKGEWAKKTAAFYFATSFDLQATKLDTAIREQTERLAKLGIVFVPWGVQEVSTLLKSHPRIVDDFFSRAWVERFCGPEAAQALANNLPHKEGRDLRTGLRDLYRAVFYAQGGIRSTENIEPGEQFVILDVDPNRQQSNIIDTERPEATDERQRPSQGPVDGHTYIASRLGARRQSFRSARHLLNSTTQPTLAAGSTIEGDEWLAGGKYRLLIGRPGAGKSSLLRFAATDLLSSQPQSIALQREHANDLPIWLPFGFLCRHLEASTENSLISAAEAWLKSQSASDLWPLVQRALQDDRLLLLVDGVDEWSDVGTADRALGIMEAFLGRTSASAILSTRPYAVDRLNWRLPWSQAEITPLTDDQRRIIAAGILPPATQPEVVPARPTWSAGVEQFLDQLATTPELAELSRSPLFLTLLAATWQGEPLPRQRFKIYARLVDLLIEKHPQMRQRASHADGGPLTATDVTTLFAAVAYRLRVKDPSGTVTKPEMRRLIVESMTDDEVLGYEQPAARKIADAVLSMAEDEFGLIVSHGAGAVGFLHRVVLDHMAGQYLATLLADDQAGAMRRFVRDPAWRDVLLALLAAQVSPHAVEPLIIAALDADDGRWADIDGHELLAEALAAGIKLTPKSHTVHMNTLIKRVEIHPSLRHRANLVTALVGTLASHAARSHLLPVMKRWLTAPRPDPSPTMWALRDLDISDDVAAEYLLWGIRHPEDSVKINAALAIAHRFGGQPQLVDQLLFFTEAGPCSATQAAAVLALGNGWAEAADTIRLIDWSRRQPSAPLRLVGLHLLQRGTQSGHVDLFRPEERDWLLSLLQHEDYSRGPWSAAELVNIAAIGDAETADFALETLKTNGRTNNGDRGLAWSLACHTFADDSRFKAWVIAELAEPKKRGLILYNVNMIPQQWRDDPAFAQALRLYLHAKLEDVTAYGVVDLTTALPLEDARAELLGSLDSWRPYAAARTLIEQYADDEHVRAALTSRLRGEYLRAAPMAGIAMDVLGLRDGFAVLVSLLRRSDEFSRREEQVVVAEAVANAWKRLEDTSQKSGAEGEAAQDVLSSYDSAELAALCTAVNPHFLMWHVPAVITAWPGQPAVQEFADSLIHDSNPVTSGIPDTIPVAILRAYCTRTDEPSRQILTKTLNLLKHIQPELREVLAFELARNSLATNDLIDVMSEWRSEPDTEVRRNAFIGLVQAVKRHQQVLDNVAGGDTLTAEMEWLCEEVKRDLCAYGPDLEERRQLAWIGMLMLGDLTLSDGIRETIGHSGQLPGVQLYVLYDGDVDQILVNLVAENWERLRTRFGDSVFERLNGTSDRQNRTVSEQRRNVMSALATVASRYPAIAEMLRIEADIDTALRQDRHFLLWVKEENRGDEGTLRAFVAKLGLSVHRQQGHELDSLIDLESWNVSDETFKSVLVEDVNVRPGHIYVDEKLAAYAQLFPNDSISIATLRDLESWFRSDRANREHRSWGNTLAIAFGTVDPLDLPAVVTRVHTRIRMGMSDLDLPLFTKPLMRRLRVDPDAVEAFKNALNEPMSIREDSPIFAGPWDPIVDACPDLLPLQRLYLFAVVLRQAGALPQQSAVMLGSVLALASPATVVHNPFTNHEGPLCLAALDLAAN